ncbi:MAG: ACT domain-containing protein [Balneolaceae bacterium]|nr:ACT domain-containing protein [Balneolaceae bacterium]
MDNLNPVLNAGEYIYCSFADHGGMKIHDPVMVFQESEGKTVIIEKQQAAELGISYRKFFPGLL